MNFVTTQGAEMIIRALGSNDTLTQLDFSKNNIPAAHAERIETALEKNRKVQVVTVWCLPVGLNTVSIKCVSIGGVTLLTLDVSRLEALAALRSQIAMHASVAEQHLKLVLPDGRLIEDSSG